MKLPTGFSYVETPINVTTYCAICLHSPEPEPWCFIRLTRKLNALARASIFRRWCRQHNETHHKESK